ncbi:hypothetical protein [Terricaulis sp.]|uniref:hypothetical protein n=1 Tax=Terricaulis sp. TaxID=2768686 RepID=UPI003783C2DE
MSLADIHERASRFQTRVQWRNMIEYGAAVIVVLAFTGIAVVIPDWNLRAAAALIIAGVGYICWKLATMAGASAKADGVSWADFHRAELVRQRDATASVWRWYLGPLLPGVVAFLLASTASPTEDLPLVARIGFLALGVGWVSAVFFGIAYINKRTSQKLQEEIDKLDAARK